MIVNLTPHPLHIINLNGEVVYFAKPTEDTVLPRVEQTIVKVGEIDGMVDYEMLFGKPQNIPIDDGNIYVVSRRVITACAEHNLDHDHLRSPGRMIRDSEGRRIAHEGLAR